MGHALLSHRFNMYTEHCVLLPFCTGKDIKIKVTENRKGVETNEKRITKSFIATTLFASALFIANDEVLAKKTFYDVENSQNSHTEAIQYLNNLNVYDYKSGNQFNFSKPVSRAEASKILQTILSSDSALAIPKVRSYNGKFKDVTNSTPFTKEIIWAYESGIFDGDEYGNFNPDQPVKRSHLSKILVESLKLNGGTKVSFKDVSNSTGTMTM